jgi:type VII secretion-associated serine protease mycosin
MAIAVLPAAPAHADRIRDDQWHLRYLKVADAHKLTQGEGVTVAVIDTGVDPHPDLRENLLPGIDTINAGSGDGRQDSDSHGTGMAGLVGAHGDSSNGALGIAPKAKILPIRYATSPGDGDPDKFADGIDWAVTQNARVISASVGGSTSPRLTQAVKAAIDADIVIVAAAGNDPPDYGITFPAYLEGVVAVGASDRNGSRAAISVKGNKMGILAPGVDIYSTSTGGRYGRGTGTSPSTAIVAGAAALIRSRYPDLSAEEVVHRLTATAVDKGPPGHDDEYGDGVLDLMAALTADVPPLAASPSAGASASVSPTAGPTATAAPPVAAPRGMSTGTLLTVFAGFLALAIVIALLVVRSHRRAAGRGAPPVDPA